MTSVFSLSTLSSQFQAYPDCRGRIKRLGIVMTEVNLQEFALSQGIKKRIKDMNQVEKVQLRYNYILEMTKQFSIIRIRNMELKFSTVPNT